MHNIIKKERRIIMLKEKYGYIVANVEDEKWEDVMEKLGNKIVSQKELEQKLCSFSHSFNVIEVKYISKKINAECYAYIYTTAADGWGHSIVTTKNKIDEGDILKIWDEINAPCTEINKIKYLRVIRNMTQEELARVSDIKISTLQKLERTDANFKKMQLGTAVKLAKALGVKAEELLI